MSHKSKEDTATLRTIRVFIASPGDLAVERRAFKEVIDSLNGDFGDGANVIFKALGWEDTLAATGRRAQGVINLDIDRCDVFVLAMHRRWGQEAPDAVPYSSYTEEEFHRAYNLWKKKPKRGQERRPEIFVFFKHIDPGQMADPGVQLQKVLDFRKQLEDSREVLYRGFTDETEFRSEIDRHLRAYAKGELPKADAARDKVILPIGALAEIQKEKVEKEAALKLAEEEHKAAEAAVARAEALALGLAESAAKAALEGRVEEARQDLAKAADGTANLQVLFLAYEFYKRTGDLAAAEEILERWLAITGPDSETFNTAAALGNLGLIYQTRGDLDKAEEMHKKSLAISEKLGRKEGMANEYASLGIIYKRRGDLDKAEEMYKKSLGIQENLGRKEGMAKDYGNLGNVYRTRGDLDKAEKMIKRSLAIEEKLGRKEGMASDYGNLGLIYRSRGDLGKAEAMYKKSLAIEEKLGRKEGIAITWCNLGELYEKSHDLDKAEEMYVRSLGIFEKLGHQEGLANNYRNLGSLGKIRGELDTAQELWTKSRDLFLKIGMSHEVEKVQTLLDSLPLEE